jgi:sulfur relay (sulfurtransferase) DsrF/TusC family protein
MSNSINKKMAELLGKMDEKVLQAKLSATIDMLKKGDMDDLVKKINKMDKNELLSKINEVDEAKLKELKISKEEIKQKVNVNDLDNLAKLIGNNGDEIIKKIKDIIDY